MPRASINGTSLHYEIHGSGEPVVFLNGVMMTVQSWAAQIAFFSPRYRCLMHDLRGQLLSDKPPGPYSMEEHAEDLEQLLDQLEVGSCHVVGTSYGGEVGMAFAAEHPERVRSLSVIASVGHVEPLLHLQVEGWAQAALHSPDTLFNSVASQTWGNRFLADNPAVLELGARRVQDFPDDFFPAFAQLVEAFQRFDLRDRLAEIAAPTLVVCGELDQLKPVAYGREIARAVDGAELVVVPDAGHAVVIEAAEVVNTIVLGFITRHGGES